MKVVRCLITYSYLWAEMCHFGSNRTQINRIMEVIAVRGIKHKWLAMNIDKSYHMMNRYVGNRIEPRIMVLNEIVRILGLSFHDLLDGELL